MSPPSNAATVGTAQPRKRRSVTRAGPGRQPWGQAVGDHGTVVSLLQRGIAANGAVYGPMAEVVHNSLQYLTDPDVRAMAVYLKSIPERNGSTQDRAGQGATSVAARVLSRGTAIYREQCEGCHLGNGQPPHYPPLARNPSIEMESAVNPIRMVLNGDYPPQTAGNPRPYGMPPLRRSCRTRISRLW